MTTLLQILLYLFAGLVIGVGVGFFVRKRFVEQSKVNIDEQGKKIIEGALAEAEQFKKEASLQIKDESIKYKQEVEKELRARSLELNEE